VRLLLYLGTPLILATAAFAQDDNYPPTDADQRAIVAKVTEKALRYGKDLPDFVSDKVTRHYLDVSGTNQQWKLTGTTTEELSYIGHKVTFKAANGKSPSSSSDEFGDLLSWIFEPKAKAEFKWNSWTNLNKRRTYVLTYRVAEADSQFTLTASKKPIAVAFSGLIWADVETGMVVRVSAVGQSPTGFTVQGATIETSYEFTKFGEQELLLPVKSEYRAKEAKSLVWNEAEFRRYRKPG
jgi:hypothetical protein